MEWLISWFAFSIAVGAFIETNNKNKKLEKRIRELEVYIGEDDYDRERKTEAN